MHASENKPPLFYPDRLGHSVVLVGAGGIGSILLPLLVKCGPRRITIWDDDTVEPVNLAQQGFDAEDIGELKVRALAHRAGAINPDLEIRAVHERRFTQDDLLDGVVVAGVDSMKSRRAIFSAVRRQADRVPLFIDGRLSRKFNEYLVVYFIDPSSREEVELYESTFFDDSEVEKVPRPEKLSAHTPILLAGFIGAGLARWIGDGRHPWKVTCDAVSMHVESYWIGKTREREDNELARSGTGT
ncbi:MAG TPA: ThiF family adenylyltransferase [Candidatus Paceibacterota bacterium]|nr:ThiF family adenylyltransferase [Candidatus Paceibacterota bacterium]